MYLSQLTEIFFGTCALSIPLPGIAQALSCVTVGCLECKRERALGLPKHTGLFYEGASLACALQDLQVMS